MAFFWFFAGIISVAAGLCYIKRGVAHDSVPHVESSAGTCTCACGCNSGAGTGEYPNADEGIDMTLKACGTTCTCTCDHTDTGDSATGADRPDASR